jgi:hypothetical protein
LPLDVELFLCESVCLEVGRRAADRVLDLPPVADGLNLHHIDFPGTIHIAPETFIAFCLNITTKSVAYHGFETILIVNGHGSNTPLIDIVARRTVLETRSLCFATLYASFLLQAFDPDKSPPPSSKEKKMHRRQSRQNAHLSRGGGRQEPVPLTVASEFEIWKTFTNCGDLFLPIRRCRPCMHGPPILCDRDRCQLLEADQPLEAPRRDVLQASPQPDHERLTSRHAGRDYRLTDVAGNVVREILA